MNADVMLDLETLGDGHSQIISVGMLRFDVEAETLAGAEPFYALRRMPRGYTISVDAGTLCWWAQQSDAARAAHFSDEAQEHAVEESEMLASSLYFLSEQQPKRLWSNGPMFDERILSEAVNMQATLGKFHEAVPYRASRDCRTIFDLARRKLGNDGKKFFREAEERILPADVPDVKHTALGDCYRQAAHVMAAWRLLTT